MMANGKDYRYWLGTLVQNLVSLHSAGFTPENIELRLRELCNFLIGGQFPRSGGFPAAGVSMVAASSSSTPLASRSRASMMMAGAPFPSTGSSPQSSSSNKVLGISKHELLREVLSMLASNLSLQRLYLEYKDQLESFSMSASMSASTMSMLHNHSTATNTTSTYLTTPKVARTVTVESNTAEEAMEKVD